MEFFKVVKGGILAAVVNIDNLVVIAAAVKGSDDGLLESGHIFRFIVARSN